MIDINTIFATALTRAVEEAIAPLSARIRELEEEVTMLRNTPPAATPPTEPVVTYDGDRPITWENIKSATYEWIRDEMNDHTSEYDHPGYDDAVNKLEEYDLESFVTEEDLASEVRDILRDTTFTVGVEI